MYNYSLYIIKNVLKILSYIQNLKIRVSYYLHGLFALDISVPATRNTKHKIKDNNYIKEKSGLIVVGKLLG